MKRVRITLFDKDYKFSSDGSEELIDYVTKRLRDLQANYKKLYEEVPFDELIVLMLCDILESEYNSRKRLDGLINKIKEKISRIK